MTHGKIQWFDLFTNNIEKAKAFYCELFNWSIEEWKKSDGSIYPMFKVGNKAFGGITAPEHPEVANSWLSYVAVDNLDRALTVLTENNAKIIDKKSVPGVGRWVIAKDPQGAIFAPFQSETKEETATKKMAGVGEFCWHELMCTDREKAFAFYQYVFNWKKAESIDMGPMGVYQMYNCADQGMGGIMNITADMPIKTPYWLEYVCVENVDQTVERALKLGAHPTFPAMNVGSGGRIAGLVDNQGIQFAIYCNVSA